MSFSRPFLSGLSLRPWVELSFFDKFDEHANCFIDTIKALVLKAFVIKSVAITICEIKFEWSNTVWLFFATSFQLLWDIKAFYVPGRIGRVREIRQVGIDWDRAPFLTRWDNFSWGSFFRSLLHPPCTAAPHKSDFTKVIRGKLFAHAEHPPQNVWQWKADREKKLIILSKSYFNAKINLYYVRHYDGSEE